jgi:hypothetical protein
MSNVSRHSERSVRSTVIVNVVIACLLLLVTVPLSFLAPSRNQQLALIVPAVVLCLPLVATAIALREKVGWFAVGLVAAINLSYLLVVLAILAVTFLGIAGTFGLLVVLLPALVLFGFNTWQTASALRAKWRLTPPSSGQPQATLESAAHVER